LSFLSTGQLYKGIPEIAPYEEKLSLVDGYLSLSPNKGKVLINELYKIADKKKNEHLKTVLHIYQGTFLYYTGQSDSAIVYFDKAVILANKIESVQLRSTASIRKLFVLQGNNNSKPILTLMEDEYEIAKKHGDTLNMIYSLNGQAMCHEILDNTEKCIDVYMNAIELAKENDNEYEYGFLLNNLGLLKLRLNSPDEAIEDFKIGLDIARRLKNTRLEVTLRENVGYYYLTIDSVDLAIQEYEESYELAKNRKFSHLAFNSLVNLGVIERQTGNYAKCDSLLDLALNMGQAEKLYYALSPIFLTMAQLELYAERYTNIQPLLDSALFYSKYTSKNEIQEGVYQITYEMLEKQGDFEEALEFYKRLSKFRDSLDKTGHMQMITELQLKYDVERKEKQHAEDKIAYEHELSQNELQTERLKQNIGLGIIVFILAIGGFIIYYFKEKHKREAQFSSALVNKLEEERGRIARDLHDGLGQSLVILKNKFNNYDSSNVESANQINENFTETIEEVRNISRSLIPPELRRLGLQKSINKMLRDIEESSQIITTSDLDVLNDINLDPGSEIRIYRIIQELANNTIKHSQASSLKVDFELQNGRLLIVYQDNGKGIDVESMSTEKSIGLRSIEQRLKFLNGTIKVEKPAKGFRAVIRIKLKS
jgi:signal transduction histidine kinase/Tfp pilus assembly protein PilF